MTRRRFLSVASLAQLAAMRDSTALIVPVHHVLDDQVKWKADQIRRFRSLLWSEAARDLMRCGIRLQTTLGAGGVWRPPYREPVVTGLEAGVINVVLTDRIPLLWDRGRALCGVTTRYRGFHLCMIALDRAHGHQMPFLSVNTCLHELLHVLLHDIFEDRPPGWLAEAREFRIDFHATRLWLFHDGGTVRTAAHSYLERLRPAFTAPGFRSPP